jgi:quercetin dioxygenase-like cupin family protein
MVRCTATPHQRVVYVVHGHLQARRQGAAFDVQAGDTLVVRAGVEHSASAVEDSLVIDVFTPCRENYIA